jgi:phospholipid/cholesterol/gamma-HCH transport system permease protein
MRRTKDSVAEFFINFTDILVFAMKYIREVFLPPYEINELIKQFFLIGYKSLLIVSITGFITGFVLVLQSVPTLRTFGAVSLIPAMVTISIIREIGPVIIGLICAGKIGSGIGAELGSMMVTEQIDAMEVQATNPFNYLVITRITATTLMLPLLVIIGDFIALIGAYIAYSITSEISITLFFTQSLDSVKYIDLIPAVIKTVFFGFVIGLIGTYQGYNAERGTESVGIAANHAVVWSSISIIFLDMIAVQITNLFM